jgi:putative pyruvate formate lyase activating enzyme
MSDSVKTFEPGYAALSKSGELARRTEALERLMSPCRLCPRECGVDRTTRLGPCATGLGPLVASHTPHFGEEPPISGRGGSGTIFLANCAMKCVYCQNHQISQRPTAFAETGETHESLAEMMLALQASGCRNINWVTPTHQAAVLARALDIAARRGLRLPIVYNTGGYDSVETLKLLDGVVDIYLPDLRYADPETGRKLSGVPDYPSKARDAVAEMFRQVGDDWVMDGDRLCRGLLIRLLVLPGGLSGTEQNIRWIAENLSPRVGVSLMSQYYPAHLAAEPLRHVPPALRRRISPAEWRSVVEAHERWMVDEKGFIQDPEESPDSYRPDFSDAANPFQDRPTP